MTLPLTKTLAQADLADLAPERALIDKVGIHGQHEMRRWEYSMALRAVKLHRPAYMKANLYREYHILDVGGAGSTFAGILGAFPHTKCETVDPKLNTTLEELVAQTGVEETVDAILSISTIEHVKNPKPFLHACSRALNFGGLFFLTFDCTDHLKEGRERGGYGHQHWLRERLYTLDTWRELHDHLLRTGFHDFGTHDWRYQGHVEPLGYAPASLALVKA